MSKDVDPIAIRRAVERGRELTAKVADGKRRDEQIRRSGKQSPPINPFIKRP